MRQRWVNALVDEKKFADARAALAQIRAEQLIRAEWLPAVLAVAEADGNLSQLINQWKKQGSSAPAEDDLRNASSKLSGKGPTHGDALCCLGSNASPSAERPRATLARVGPSETVHVPGATAYAVDEGRGRPRCHAPRF